MNGIVFEVDGEEHTVLPQSLTPAMLHRVAAYGQVDTADETPITVFVKKIDGKPPSKADFVVQEEAGLIAFGFLSGRAVRLADMLQR